jgi:ribosomal protein L11 methyltransferase
MDYIELNVPIAESEMADIITAELSDLPFDSFVAERDLLKAYIPQHLLIDCKDDCDAILARYGINNARYVQIEAQNWNALWESNFEEVEVKDKVLIRAPFHDPRPNYKGLEVIIQPKMSFGTGHHATTRLMVEMLLGSKVEGRRILDMGSGTGVLAIVAAKLGAESVLAVEIDDMAEESVRENIVLNGVAEKVVSVCGDAKAIEGERFDIVLANINRNVLLADMKAYAATLSHGGELIMSGFLEEDIPLLLKKAKTLGLKLVGELAHEEWRAIRVQNTRNKVQN